MGVVFPLQMWILIYSLYGCQFLWIEGCVKAVYSISIKQGLILLTLYGDSIDEPANLGFGLSIDSTSQDASLIRGKDQVSGSTDPERSRCGLQTQVKKTEQDLLENDKTFFRL